MTDSATLASLSRALGPKYEVRRLIGSGGFAEVYEVWDKDLERRLAVKVLRPDVAWTSGMIERFQRETRAAARLEHPNILPIHFVGEGEGLVYYAMPFVDGSSLGDLLKRSGALPAERALAIIIPILDALDHAHKAGLIHRDIKPDNIMLDVARGRPLLVDFGIARRLDPQAGPGLTQTGLVVGTPHYMSPEQALGDPNLDRRSDIYSLGAVLFQMVTGGPPFDGDSSQQIVGKHIAEPPPAAQEINRKVPRELSDVIARCLAKQPADRYQSAAAVIAALESEKQPSVMRSRATAAQAATELMVSGATKLRMEREAQREAERTVITRTSKPRRWGRGRIILAIAVPLLLLGAGGFWFLRPTVVFSNNLFAAVDVVISGESRRVRPREGFSMKVPWGRPLEVSWLLQQRLGVPFGDTTVVARPRGRIAVAATASPRHGAYFAPLITNQTGVSLTITVNAGLAGSRRCNCTIPPGAFRLPIGYYRLFQNSTVRAEANGRSATFRDLGPQVSAANGTVGLEFRAGDLR
ncbi:MAG TPA: serine/threonine-protein kinase [Gemmatimonadales bacterium]|nr:serine/threonine-protein kinase [Gemmatimonadales bacterium]